MSGPLYPLSLGYVRTAVSTISGLCQDRCIRDSVETELLPSRFWPSAIPRWCSTLHWAHCSPFLWSCRCRSLLLYAVTMELRGLLQKTGGEEVQSMLKATTGFLTLVRCQGWVMQVTPTKYAVIMQTAWKLASLQRHSHPTINQRRRHKCVIACANRPQGSKRHPYLLPAQARGLCERGVRCTVVYEVLGIVLPACGGLNEEVVQTRSVVFCHLSRHWVDRQTDIAGRIVLTTYTSKLSEKIQQINCLEPNVHSDSQMKLQWSSSCLGGNSLFVRIHNYPAILSAVRRCPSRQIH